MKRGLVVGGFIAVAILIGAVLLYNARWIDQERRLPLGPEAQRNQFLAAERFLDELGVPAESRDGYALLESLPEPDRAIVLGGSRLGLSERRVDALMNWVDAGGLLILQVNEEFDDDSGESGDLLLDRLGVALIRPLDDSLEDVLPEGLSDALASGFEAEASDCDAGIGMTEVNLDGEDQPAFVNFPAWRSIDYYGDAFARYASNPSGTQLLYLSSESEGGGAYVVLTDLSIWTNNRIGCFDHAHVLRHLAAERSGLDWLYNVNMPSLLTLILRSAPWTVALAGIALLVWLWRSFVRTRRSRLADSPARREVMEHVDARARFAWQHGKRDGLLKALRAQVAGGRISAEELSELAGLAGVSEQAARSALSDPAPRRQDQFTTLVRTLQRLRHAQNPDDRIANTEEPHR